MATIAETAGAPHQLASGLIDGVNTISENQSLTFTKYIRLVLPLDGYVYWVNSDLVSGGALLNAMRFNDTPVNTSPSIEAAASTFTAPGSVHYATQVQQNEDATLAINSVVFTAQQQIQDFNDIGPNVMYLATFQGIRFSFNVRGKFYQQSGLYHYRGDAVYSVMDSQIIDSVTSIDMGSLVVSNSLPIWLAMNEVMPVYPSFLVPQNLPPPYAAIHIEPSSTKAIGTAPVIDRTGSHSQLAMETVKITIYGSKNNQALDFQDYIFQQSLDYDNFGVMNMPIMQDEKRTQSELSVIAMKKTFTLDVSYYQNRARDIARQFILKALISIETAAIDVNV